MPTTPNLALPYASLTDAPNVPADILALADAIDDLHGSWTAYVPTFTAAFGTPALGDGTIAGRYLQVGKTIKFASLFTAGASTTYGTAGASLRFGLPAAALNSNTILSAFVGDASIGSAGYSIAVALTTASAAYCNVYLGDLAAARTLAGNAPQVLAVGDRVWWSGIYETT